MSSNPTPLEKFQQNPVSKRLAINAKCWDCTYDPANGGTWRQQVAACEIQSCSLWLHRPKSEALSPSEINSESDSGIMTEGE